jgi:hypothetical protein
LLSGTLAIADQAYVPPPADQVPGYFAAVMPCKIVDNDTFNRKVVECEGDLLAKKTLRELSILRNTIYARYGWSGFRKQWLKEHFSAQAWFKPNAKFAYKMISDVDRKNAHFIGTAEASLKQSELERRRDELLARHGKVWNDKPRFRLKSGKEVIICDGNIPKDAELLSADDDRPSRDCEFAKEKWYRPDSTFTMEKLSADDKIELGLIARALGDMGLEWGPNLADRSLDQLLKIEELRQLSVRDLRILRNNIYAHRGRPFKSKFLQEHFSNLDWYKIDPSYTDKKLTKTDERNIKLIKTVENEFGGPVDDQEWLTEPLFDMA